MTSRGRRPGADLDTERERERFALLRREDLLAAELPRQADPRHVQARAGEQLIQGQLAGFPGRAKLISERG